MGVREGGDLGLSLLQEVQQKIKTQQCRPDECREAELATIAHVDMSEVSGMSRAEVIVRVGDRTRLEGFSCRIRKKGSGESWERGLCRRYGVKVFHFVPFESVRQLTETKTAVARTCGEPEFAPLFEESLEARIGKVLLIEEYEIINDFEWALERTGAQVQRTEQQLGRLRSDMKKLGGAYRRLLNSRTGGGRRDRQADTAKKVEVSVGKGEPGQSGPER
jgi:hypothetical protein